MTQEQSAHHDEQAWDRWSPNGARSPGQPIFQPLDNFVRAYEPLSYVIDGVVRSGSLYTLTARTGHGKTGILVGAALAIATGNPDILGRDVVQSRVAYIAAENPDDLRMRLATAAFRHNININEIGSRIMILDRRMPPEEIVNELERLSKEGHFGIVIVDTLAAFFDGKDFNDAVQAGDFMRRLRPLTRLPGLPATLVAAHPVKSATTEHLIPYGSGAILNEVDGNLTLWKAGDLTTLHWQGKLRGLDFRPLTFKFEECSNPDLLDAKGRPVTIPVCLPTAEEAVEERAAAEGFRNMAVLNAIASNPKATQRAWMTMAKLPSGTFTRALRQLAQGGFVEKGADNRWRLTPKGKREIET